MNFVETNIKWLMLVSGVLTCTMVYAALAPVAALQSTFGESLNGPLAELIVRNQAGVAVVVDFVWVVLFSWYLIHSTMGGSGKGSISS